MTQPARLFILNMGKAQTGYVRDIVKAASYGGVIIEEERKYIDLPAPQRPDNILAICCGSPSRKKELFDRATGDYWVMYKAIHPAATISPEAVITSAIINPGAVVAHGAFINHGVMIHSGCVIDHDCTVGAFCNLAPGVTLAGGVTLKEGVIVYTGASIGPGVTIGAGSIIGAGAVVLGDVPEGRRAWGVPARSIGPVKEEGE